VSPISAGCQVPAARRQRTGESGGAAADLFSKRPALLPPYTIGSVRIRSNLDIKLGRVIGGWQWRAADRGCASRCGHSSRRASGLGVAFVGALCRRVDSQGVDPRSLNWKISSPGKSAGPEPRPFNRRLPTLGRPLVSPGRAAMWPPSANRYCEPVGVPRAFGVTCHSHFPAPPQSARQST
jgi:hypothetical protein